MGSYKAGGFNMIKFDLHIHSVASRYKEEKNIVDDSTTENINVLLSKLNEHQVALFSITDHNRFNVELYREIDKILSNPDCEYENVKAVLSGVEFDVKIDEAMNKCHIITIFDSKNNPENYEKINTEINKNLLTGKDDFYTKENFEQLLYNIGLNTVLIACQRKDIHNHNGHHNSLSDSSNRVEEIIKVGYINALEYQKPKVEGILKNNLKELPYPVSLVTGSDCHMWSCYPYHDNTHKNTDFYHSKSKIMPTFKGLLMAITSPETRFNCRENNNTVYINGIKTKDETIPLENGVNAIIGENGSGKSTLLKFINKKTSDAFVKEIIKKNQLELVNSVDLTKVKYIGQGDIINGFNKKTLFASNTDSNFNELDNSNFIEKYTRFADLIKKSIKIKIKQKDAIDSLKSHAIRYNPDFEEKNYFVNLVCQNDFDSVSNIHDQPLKKLIKIILDLRIIKAESYFHEYIDEITKAESSLLCIYQQIKNKWELVNAESKVKNAIQSSITNYNLKVNSSSSARDKEKREYLSKRQNVIDAVINAIKSNSVKIPTIAEPEVQSGVSKNTKRGFCFNREANYNNVSMLDSFLAHLFNKDNNSLESILQITTNSDFVNALRNCSSELDIENKWKANFNKFIDDAIQVKEYITDGTDIQIGNTLGEMSLSFYKYYTQGSDEWNVLIIDQPEDNISNNNICKHLLRYFNSIRDTKQLIFVTHNPLLVVNLDVDNVIYIQNNGGELSFKSGYLEYEDKETNILEIIAQNMDGGKESIEKRLKVYGKEN